MISSCSSVAVGFRFFAVAKLVSCKGKIGKPAYKKHSAETQNPVFFYINKYIFHLKNKYKVNLNC